MVGTFERGQAEELTGYKERMARDVLAALLKKGFLVSEGSRAPVRLGFPVDVVERWFPQLYPATKQSPVSIFFEEALAHHSENSSFSGIRVKVILVPTFSLRQRNVRICINRHN